MLGCGIEVDCFRRRSFGRLVFRYGCWRRQRHDCGGRLGLRRRRDRLSGCLCHRLRLDRRCSYRARRSVCGRPWTRRSNGGTSRGRSKYRTHLWLRWGFRLCLRLGSSNRLSRLFGLLISDESVSLGASPSAVCLRFDDAGRVTFHSDSERVAEVQHLFVRHAELSSELEHADLLFSQGVLLSSGIEI